MESNQPVLTIYNRHAASCGEPPHMSNAERSRYYGYFQNEHGDQWLFVYDRAEGTAILRGGDAQWERVHSLRGPNELPVSMTESEKAWVVACWAAASFGAGLTG